MLWQKLLAEPAGGGDNDGCYKKARKIVKFGIAPRLFAAMLLGLAVLGAVEIVTIRWSLLAGRSERTKAVEPAGRDLIAALEASYRQHGGWDFLPADHSQRRRWLHAFWLATLKEGPRGEALATDVAYGDRIGLLDAKGKVLSGVAPGPWLRAIGSIDTKRTPLTMGDRTVGYLMVAGAGNSEDTLAVAFLLQRGGRLGAIAATGLLLAITLALLLASYFRRPIRKLVDGARRLEAGRFETRMDDGRGDELGELARTFNHLAARLERTELARRQWVADTSHELRTPLAVLHAQIESLQDGVRAPTPDNLGLMLTHVESLSLRVDDLHALARADMAQLHYQVRRLDLRSLLQSVADGFRDRATTAGLTLTSDAPASPLRVMGDADRLRQVLVNLLENAVRYTDAGGQVRIEAEIDGASVLITIDDSAPGVAEPSLSRLGERFFRTDSARAGAHGGAGLGLALARQIVEAHKGWLTFSASALGGLQARVSLPEAGVE
jgi:two-component system sensor histidine kinase BaeS